MSKMRIGIIGAFIALATSVALLMCIVGVQGGLLGKLQRALVDVRASYFEIFIAPDTGYRDDDSVVERVLTQISCVKSIVKVRHPHSSIPDAFSRFFAASPWPCPSVHHSFAEFFATRDAP